MEPSSGEAAGQQAGVPTQPAGDAEPTGVKAGFSSERAVPPPRAGAQASRAPAGQADGGPPDQPSRAARRTLAEAFDPRSNNLNAIRLILATLVLVSHSWQFVLEKDPLERHTVTPDIGEVCVDGFFVVSGFLITRSRLRVSGSGRYLWHRFLRIMPGFWVCLAVTAVAFGPLLWWLERDTLDGYPWTGPDSSLSYVISNFALRMNQFNIGDLNGGYAIDGSLHTLFFEFLCYLMIGALGALGLLRPRVIGVLAAGGLLIAAAAAATGADWLVHTYTLRFAVVFLVGAAMFMYADRVPLTPLLAAAAAGLLAFSLAITELYLVFGPLTLSYLLLYAGSGRRLAKVGARNDLSYGIYVYAWPIQVLVLAAGVGAARDGLGLAAHIAVSLPITVLAAAVSWRLIESPALDRKSIAPPWRRAARGQAA